ncbi:hypothetical protein M9435_000166 [Picochlorum sp. BPE23]|nr:hypothetical protein M9435_000166 [Picochlorum sp. BPE23]
MGRINSSSQNSDCPHNYSGWLEFIRSVYVCRKLGPTISKYASKDVVNVIDAALLRNNDADLFRGTDSWYNSDEVSSDALDQVLDLVIETTEGKSNFKEMDTFESPVYKKLNKLLYPSSFRKNTFMQSVWYGHLGRASISARICEIILLDSISTENCFSILLIGLECGCEELSTYCYQYCLAHFQEAIEYNQEGLTSLPFKVLKSIVQEDRLCVEDEEVVLCAISLWVEHALPDRLASFVDLFAKGIRFSEIDYSKLANIVDSYDLVASNHAAVELAAHELIQKTMGTCRENALGLGTICRPRVNSKHTYSEKQNTSILSEFILKKSTRMGADAGKENMSQDKVENVWEVHMLQSPTKPLVNSNQVTHENYSTMGTPCYMQMQ